MRLIVVLLTVLLAACGAPQPPLVATDVEITRPMPGRQMSAGFLVLTNNTDEPIHITSAASQQFGSVEIHETTVEDGISRMRRLDALVVPAHGSVTLERGGKHLMLMNARDIGDAVSLKLFAGDMPVLELNYAFPGDE